MIKFTEKFPDHISIDGINYPINTDYRIMAEFETKINNTDISDKEAFSGIISETIKKLFLVIPDTDINKVIKGILKYYRCGKDMPENNSHDGKRIYDYDQDSDQIYAAFFQQYGDDLINSKMHWWEFRAKFLSLTEDTEFVKILQYRCTDISKIKNADERDRIRKLQSYFALKRPGVKKYPSIESRDSAIKNGLQKRFDEVKEKAYAINGKE